MSKGTSLAALVLAMFSTGVPAESIDECGYVGSVLQGYSTGDTVRVKGIIDRVTPSTCMVGNCSLRLEELSTRDSKAAAVPLSMSRRPNKRGAAGVSLWAVAAECC